MESTIDVSCIICGFGGGLTMLAHTEEIAYFGEHTQVTLSCPGCGWRQTDFIPAEARDGSCQTYHIDTVEDYRSESFEVLPVLFACLNWIWRCARVHIRPVTYPILKAS